MATLTVGSGKTYSTILAAHAAASNGDTIEVYPNANDAYTYFENNLVITKGVTIVGMVTGACINIQYSRTLTVGNGGAITGTCTIKNMKIFRSAYTINPTSGNVVFENCVLETNYSYINFDATARGASNITFKNCIFLGSNNSQYPIDANAGSGGNLKIYYCTFVGCWAGPRLVTANFTDIDVRNCVSISASNSCWNVTGTLNASSGYNASGDTSTAGSNNVTNLTHAQADFFDCMTFTPESTSSLFHAAVPITGITTDISGNTRSVTTPSIGASEGPATDYPAIALVKSGTSYNNGSLTGTRVDALEEYYKSGEEYGDPLNPLTGTYIPDIAAPGNPTITSATPASGQVALAVTADEETDNIYAIYKIAGGSWSAESESFKVTGSGNIAVTGLTNGTPYIFAVYAKSLLGVTSAHDLILAMPTDGTRPIIELADLVVTALNDNSFSQSFTAERKYIKYEELKDLSDIACYVVMAAEENGSLTRARDDRRPMVRVVLIAKAGTAAENDALVVLQDEIYRYLRQTKFSNYAYVSATIPSIYNQEWFDEMNVIASGLELTYFYKG